MTFRAFACLALSLLAGCASTGRPVTTLSNPQGLALARGQSAPAITAPAARVGCAATLRRGNQTFKFDVWLEVDSSLGRLDALGPFNTPLASVVWSDSSWKTWLPVQNILLRGNGPILNLPVLDLKEICPSTLSAPLLGRATQARGPFRVIPAATSEQVAVLPDGPDPRWSLLLDTRTGLPLRRQTLSDGQESEGFSYSDWKDRNGVLVPSKIVRTTPDGQILELVIKDWSRMDAFPHSHLLLKPPPGIDTISIGMQENGRKVFRIRAGTGDSTVVVLPYGDVRPSVESQADLESSEDTSTASDSLASDDDSDDGDGSVDESDDPDEDEDYDTALPAQTTTSLPSAKESKKRD